MVKETQRQNRMRRPSFMPDKEGEQDDARGDEHSLHQPDLSLTEIHEGPHQATAASAGEKGAGIIESADALPDAFVHSDDDQSRSDERNRHVNQERPAP